jgi:Flp pilus assembly CpaE family ATPase
VYETSGETVVLATVSSESSFHRDVRAALDTRFRFEAVWDLSYEDAARLHSVKSDEKCLNIIDFKSPAQALPVVRMLCGRPQVTTIAANCGNSKEELLLLMQAGVRDVLPQFTTRDLLQTANRALALLGSAGEIVGDIHAFVPAKAGCGATTVATYTAGMASRLADEPTLLLDFDIQLGLTTFLLKALGTHTIMDALELVDRLDPDVWASLISQSGNLHLLGSGAGDFSHSYLPEQFRKLLDYAVRQYSVVAVDLPGAMADYECEVLLRAKRILMICTPDIGALHVARRKAQWFRDLQLTDRVSVVVNNVEGRNALSVQDIERIIQLPVRYMLPSGIKDVSKAAQKGAILEANCALGRKISEIAGDMIPAESIVGKANPVRRFVEYFSVNTVRGARGV